MNSNIAGKLGSSPPFRIVELLNKNYFVFQPSRVHFPVYIRECREAPYAHRM